MAYTTIPAAAPSGSTVTSVVGGSNVTIDSTTPSAPIVNAATQFGSDTTIALPDSGAANQTALELVTSLAPNTAGAESGKLVFKLPNAHVLQNSLTLLAAGMETDELVSPFTWTMRSNGTAVGSISYTSLGNFSFSGTGASAGIRFYTGATVGTGLSQSFSANFGFEMFTNPLQLHQGSNLASASTLPLVGTATGGNSIIVTGTTTINLLASGWTDFGTQVTLQFSGALTVKHNQAPSGNNKPMLLAGSADFSAVAGSVLMLRFYSDSTWKEEGRTNP